MMRTEPMREVRSYCSRPLKASPGISPYSKAYNKIISIRTIWYNNYTKYIVFSVSKNELRQLRGISYNHALIFCIIWWFWKVILLRIFSNYFILFSSILGGHFTSLIKHTQRPTTCRLKIKNSPISCN